MADKESANKKSFGDYAIGANNFLSTTGIGSKLGTTLSELPNVPSLFGGMGADQKYGSITEDQKAAQSAISSFIGMIPEYGQLISTGLNLVQGIGNATGLSTSNLDNKDAEKAGIKSSWVNNAINYIPGVSTITGGLSRVFGNKRTSNIGYVDDVLNMSDGFGAIVSDLNSAKNMSNKSLLFGQTDKANDFINSQQQNVYTLRNIQKVNTQRKQSDYYQDLQNQNINRYAGQNYLNMTVGKNGMKLMSVEEAREIIALRKKAEENPEKFQNGGNIPGIDTNLIPDGARHKNLNHLDEVNPELEDVTKKGIPVTESSANEQVAEIEVGEIIFRLDVTEKLESLMKDGSEEAMLEAGRLVATEIIENTTDNTGQIAEENGNTDSNNKQ